MYTRTHRFNNYMIGLLVIFLFAMTGSSEASSLLYDQSPVDPVDGHQGDTSAALLADDFDIAHSNLESITWWGAYLSEDTDDFVVKLYSDLAGTGTLLHDFGSVSVVQHSFTDSSATPYYQYQLDLSAPLELSTGKYYLSIQNQGLSSWVWLYGNHGNGSFWNLWPSTDWSLATDAQGLVVANNLAFSLEGSPVPEPGTLILMLLAGGQLTMSRKFRPFGRRRA